MAVAGITQVIDSLSKKEYDKISAIKRLIDTSRLLCNLHYQHTEVRRRLIVPFLDKGESLKENQRDSFLYSNLEDAIKTHQIVKKAANSLRPRPALAGGTNSLRSISSGS